MAKTIRVTIGLSGVLGLMLTGATCSKAKDATTEAASKKEAAAAPAKKEAAAPAKKVEAGGGGAAKLLGTWVGDPETMAKRPELEGNPTAQMYIDMVKSMKMTFEADKVIAEMMGAAQTAGYKVVASSGNGVTIESTEGEKKGTQTVLEFIDDTHITMAEKGKGGPPMVLKRQ